MQIKSELRKQTLLLRAAFDGEKRSDCSQKIARNLYGLKEYNECAELFCYFSKKEEISTEDIIQRALNEGKRLALPVCVGNDMIFRYISGIDDLEKGSFGVYEPESRCEQAFANKSTVCITPALCCNRDGYRIGYGKGFYDRFFEKNQCIKIALCYDEFIKDFEPWENDISADIIVTENRIIYVGRSNNQKQRQEGR